MDYEDPQYPMYPQVGPTSQFLQSPGMAMAGSALQNMSAMRRGQAAPFNPFAEMSEHRRRNEALQQRRFQMLEQGGVRDLAMQKARQNLDPFFEYEQFKTRYPEQAEGMTFADFQKIGLKGLSAPSSQREYEFLSQLTPEQQTQFMDMKRAGYGYEGPGGSKHYREAGGNVDTLVTPQEAITGDSQARYATKEAELQAGQDSEFRTAAASLPDLEASIEDTKALMASIQSGEFQNTGFFEGRVLRMTDKDTAKLAAKQVMQTLKNLQITNLAPVTEKEIALIEDLYASVLKDPAANIGALEAAIEMMESKINGINQMGSYFVNNGNTLKDYGISQRWKTDNQKIKATLPED